MKTSSLALAAICALGCLPAAASAAPVHATFDGTVGGSTGFFSHILTDFPVGTVASFDLSFDDGFLANGLPLAHNAGPASGTLRLGGDEVLIDHAWIFGYTIAADSALLNYILQLTGTGPSLTGNGAFFGLFLALTPQLALAPGGYELLAGYGYPSGNATLYSYARLDGDFDAAANAVPLPATASLLLAGLALLGRRRAK